MISDIPAGDGKTANCFLQCRDIIVGDNRKKLVETDSILLVKYAASVLTAIVLARTKKLLTLMVLIKIIQLTDVRNGAVLL